MKTETSLLYYLQQHENTKNQFSNFTQIPNTAESLQITTNSYLKSGSSISSKTPLMVITGRYPEYSVENHINGVTDNLISNTGPEPINLSLQQNWIHRRTSLNQVTLDSAAQNCFSALRIEIKYHCK